LLLGLLAIGYSVIIDKPDGPPRMKWIEVGRSNPDKMIKLLFSLKNQNLDILQDTLLAVSTPGHPKYGQFLTGEEVQTLVAPKRESVKAVRDWLENQGFEVVSRSYNDEHLQVTTTIGQAELLLYTEYWDYRNPRDPESIVARVKQGMNYEIPSSMAKHIDLVTPTHRLPMNHYVRKTGIQAGAQTPTTLKALYNAQGVVGKASNNSEGVASFQLQYYSMSDLTSFWSEYNIQTDMVTNVPSNTPSGEHLEAELDTQYESSMGELVPMQVWYNSGNFEDALMTWTTNVINDANRPLIFSVSYGTTESYYGEAYITKLNAQLQQMGAVGVTVFFASGDSGAGGGCVSPPYEPDYPASSPWVTAVGGLTGGSAVNNKAVGESCWVDGGGGFSNYAGIPSWQSTAVQYYLSNANGLPDSKDYNSSGRGFPDIAAQSVDYEIMVNGRLEGVSGTSCSSPTSAGIFALLNDLRLQNGMAQFGFVNPWIYTTAAADATAFNDCLDGYNKGCGLGKGFPAQSMWDACSGWGSPNYGQLATHALSSGVPSRRFY
jgi:tripeptidyl-peptidase-1